MTILALESLHPDAEALLDAAGRVLRAGVDALPPPESDLTRVEAIITRGRGQVTTSLLDACPALRAVGRCGAGLDNIDLEAARERGIVVVYAPGKTGPAVAEHTMMLILALARNLPALGTAVKAGRWAIRNGYQGRELRGKTLGVVGMGTIGRCVADLALAFDMRVVYWNRSPIECPFKAVSMDNLLAMSDFVTLHLPLNKETEGIMGPAEFARMKADAVLINTARGGLIDETALQQALSEDRLGGFAADLLVQDPPDPSSPLLHHEKTLITPHSAALTDVTFRDLCVYTVSNVLHVLKGTAPDRPSVYR